MSGTGDGGAAPPVRPKEDPETLVLRGRPRPPVRIRRGLIVAIAGTASALLVTIAWAALEPPDLGLAAREAESREPLRGGLPEELANVPSSYGNVPRLGPPLPGDLGRPILDRRREMEGEADPAGSAAPLEADPALARAEAERERLARALEQARASSVLVRMDQSGVAGGPVPAPGVAEGRAPPDTARPDSGDTNAHLLRLASSPWTLSAGTVIPASLITGLNSDLPGIVIAQVTEHVRDSATGATILVPQGSRLIGSYASDLAFGQSRALLVWKRIVFPDASSIQLDDVPGTDRSGRSGVRDRVDVHGLRLLKGIALSTLLGVGTELQFGDEKGGLVEAVRRSAQQDSARAGEQLTSRNLDIPPTIEVRPGWPVTAILHKDLVLRPWKG